MTAAGAGVRLPAVVEHHLFRIGQEAMTNALKHSGARQVEVVVRFEPSEVELRILARRGRESRPRPAPAPV